jgi:hypothetical protein
MATLMLQTGPGVFEVLANVCRSHYEAIKQFVENAADAIQQVGTDEGRISIQLCREESGNGQGTKVLKRIIIADNGVGMTADKMKQILQHIGDSEKVQMALRGEKGIGLLAFSTVAQELHLASTAADGDPSSCLVLKSSWLKTGQAEVLEQCSRHIHAQRGTVAYLEGILPEIAAKLAKESLKEYLGREFASDLRQGLYAMSISDDHAFDPVPPQRFRGIKAMATNLALGKLGSATVELHVLPWEMADATVSLYGRGGTRICLLTDLDDFKTLPWLDKRLEGYIRCDSLKRTADKTAVVQDHVYQAFVSSLRRAEPEIMEMISRISADSRERRFQVVLGKASKLIDKYLRYRDKGLLADLGYRYPALASARGGKPPGNGEQGESLPGPEPLAATTGTATAQRPRVLTRAPHIEIQSPPRSDFESRSWYDAQHGYICVNREHTEFLLAQREDARCVRYLFSIWVKETLLQEYGADAERLGDEMVGVLAGAEPLLW